MSKEVANADDELRNRIYNEVKLWMTPSESLQFIDDFMPIILADRKKHELQAKKNGFYMAAGLFGADASRVEELWYKCERELEKL